MEAENQEPEAEGWDASWEGYDDQEWQPEAEGEKNHLSIGALDEDDPEDDKKPNDDEEGGRRRRHRHRRRRDNRPPTEGRDRTPARRSRSLMRRRSAPPPRPVRLGSVERRLNEQNPDSDDDWGPTWKGKDKGKGKGSKGSPEGEHDLLDSVLTVALENDHLEAGNPTAMSANPSQEELERLRNENQRLQEQLRLALETINPRYVPAVPKETPKSAPPRVRPRAARMVQQRSRSSEPPAVPRQPPPKPPSRVDAYDWSILPDDEWRAMRFRERVDYKAKLRTRVPRGTVGEQQIDAQGGECTTCDERTPVVTRAAMAYANKRQIYPKAKPSAEPSVYGGTFDAEDGGEEIPSRSGVPRSPKAVPKKPKGAMKPPEPPAKSIQKGSMKPPEPKLPPKKATAKKAGSVVDPKASGKATAMPTTTGTALVSAVRGVISTQLLIATQDTEDAEHIAKAKAMVAQLRERPRRSVTITEENINDQSFHDSRYYAALAKGMPHHQAWKEERARRRSILHRRTGTAERARERIELDRQCLDIYSYQMIWYMALFVLVPAPKRSNALRQQFSRIFTVLLGQVMYQYLNLSQICEEKLQPIGKVFLRVLNSICKPVEPNIYIYIYIKCIVVCVSSSKISKQISEPWSPTVMLLPKSFSYIVFWGLKYFGASNM